MNVTSNFNKRAIVCMMTIALLISTTFTIGAATNRYDAHAASKLKISVQQGSAYLTKKTTATLALTGGTEEQLKDVQWSSSDKSIATVSKAGKVNPKDYGIVKITAKTGEKKLTKTIYIAPAQIKVNYYKGEKNAQYLTISGEKYAAANAKLKKAAKKTYESIQAIKSDYKKADAKDQEFFGSPDAFIAGTVLQQHLVFIDQNRISVKVYDSTWEYSAQHPIGDHYGINLYKGKVLGIKAAFKNTANYKAADTWTKNYWKKHLTKDQLSYSEGTDRGLKNASWWWTKSGIRLTYSIYYLGPYVDGEFHCTVPTKYLKYQ